MKFESYFLFIGVFHYFVVMRLIDDAFKNDIPVAVCSTSNQAAVTTIVKKLLGDRIDKIQIFAGDVVANKKPNPDVYLLAASTLKVEPSRCWVIEDSNIGLRAAKSAGMRCLVTKSIYTADEDFSTADVCINDLDRGLDGPITVTYLNYKAGASAYKAVKSVDNAETFGSSNNMANIMNKIAKGDMGGGFPF
jgi:phosphoglycolate phosphatase-like HAD superfamily hydrolase